MSKNHKTDIKVGDHVQWSRFGRTGDTGEVLKVTHKKQPQPGGVFAHVRVRWDSNGHEGTVEDRQLKRLAKGSSNARPKGLSEEGQRAHKAIMTLLMREGANNTYGCHTFYSPTEWVERGEEYGLQSLLLVVYDGSEAAPYFSLDSDYPHYTRHTKMSEALEAAGFFAEECTTWYSAIYKK